jgi:hypothetical protein
MRGKIDMRERIKRTKKTGINEMINGIGRMKRRMIRTKLRPVRNSLVINDEN